MTKKCFLAAALTVTALLSPVSARTASAQLWSKVASGCVADSASAAKAGLDSGFGTVGFKGTKVGRIRLTCPVSGIFGSSTGPYYPQTLNVSYYDTDGRGAACEVHATLLRSNLDARERGSNIVEFNSTTGASATEPGTGRTLGSVTVPEAIDFSTSYYWVQLELVRSSTACIPLAVGVYLAPLIVIP
jgi:hypothetical protein